MTQTDAVMISVNIELDVPAFVTPGENEAAYNTNGCAGNHVVWMTPSGTALVIDQNNGQEKMDDKDIEALFKK